MSGTNSMRRLGAMTVAACLGMGTVLMAGPALADGGNSELAIPDTWEEIQEIVGGINGHWTGDAYQGAYSNNLPNTALLGNGDLGVASAGGPGVKTFLLSKSDFISAGDMKGAFNSGNNSTKPIAIGGITVQAQASDVVEEDLGENLAPSFEAVRASSYHDHFVPDLAVSGNMERSPNGYGWVTKVGKEHWLELSYAEPITVQHWKVMGDGEVRADHSQNNPGDFRLQISETAGEDGIWTDVDVVTGNTKDTFAGNLEAPATSKHFRLLVTEPLRADNGDSNPRARIGQLEFYSELSALHEPEEEAPAIVTEETQDILNAEIQTTMAIGGVPVQMETWLAADDNVLVTQIASQGEESVELEVKTWGKNDNDAYPASSSVEQEAALAGRSTFNNAPDNPASWRSEIVMATKVLGADSTQTADAEEGASRTDFTLEPGQTVQVVTAIGGGGQNYKHDDTLAGIAPKAAALDLLTAADSADELAQLRGATAQWWKDYWTASAIDLPGQPEVMRYYYGAQYMFASTARAGKLAPGLFGVWHTTDNPSWASDYHMNYNFIATFYGSNSSNRSDFSLPAVEAMLSFVDEGKRRAADPEQLRRINRDYVDSRPDLHNGIENALLYPVGIGPWGRVTDDTYLSEALNASYSSYPLIQYFLYTQDEQYLDEKVYDYLESAFNFYDAWLDKSAEPYTLYAGYNEGSWAINPAVELAALKNVLSSLIDASVVLDRDAEKRAHWQTVLDNLAEQPTSMWKDQKVYSLAEQEWRGGQWQDLANPVPGDGNIIPLDIVVPGGQLGYYSTAEEHETARNTIDVFGDGAWRQINNFPRIFNDAVQNRYPAEGVLRNLTETINRQIQPNLRISDGAHGVEKIGATAAVNNMLLISDQGVTKVFPNWLESESAAFSTLRAEGAFLFSAAYDGETQKISDVTVTSEAGKPLTVASPWAEGVDVYDSKGELVLTSEGTAPNWEDEVTYTFDTVVGETYTLKPFTEKPEVPGDGDGTDGENPGDGDGTDGETPGDGDGGQKPGKDDGKTENVTGETDEDLAKTGAEVFDLVAVGLLTLSAGAGLMYMRRRQSI